MRPRRAAAPSKRTAEAEVAHLKAVCVWSAVSIVLGFVLICVFGDRFYCYREPGAGPNNFNRWRYCVEVGATTFDGVVGYLAGLMVLGGVFVIFGSIAWSIYNSVRRR